jgi:hypothetical protein
MDRAFTLPRAAAAAIAAAFFLRCADGAAPGGASNAQSSREAGDDDAGAPSDTYPAYTPDVGAIVKGNGYVMHDPVFVSVTWNVDAAQDLIDTFVDGLGTSAYWKTVAAEYGLGAPSSGSPNHVHMRGRPPQTLTETADAGSDLWELIEAGVIVEGWPAPTRDTVYALFLPPGTELELQTADAGAPSNACHDGIGGYHSVVTSPWSPWGAQDIAYVVIPSCRPKGSPVPQLSTLATSHELVEVAANPYGTDGSGANLGWYGFDDRHFALQYYNGLQGELADVCELVSPIFSMGDASFPYLVQRIWSNASGAAGHDPCVPAGDQPYFNVTPFGLDDVEVTVPGELNGGVARKLTTRGLRLGDGHAGRFTVGFYSDRPTGGPWTLAATPGNPVLAGGEGDPLAMANPSRLRAELDRTSGQNGETAQVTVTVDSTGAAFHGELLTLTSTLNGVNNRMPIWIGAE